MNFSMSNPSVYLFFQGIIGATRARRLTMSEYVDYLPGQRILDIGCGPGYVSKYFKDVNYCGFDTEEDYVKYANAKYGDRGYFFCQEFDDDAVQQFEPFDIVIMNGLLHHLPDDKVISLFLRIKHVLKPKGNVVTLDCYCADDQGFFVKKMLEMDRGKYIRHAEDYKKLASGVFSSVISHIRDDLMIIPYPLVILQIT
jgi:SAM-dependent methyltransferase